MALLASLGLASCQKAPKPQSEVILIDNAITLALNGNSEYSIICLDSDLSLVASFSGRIQKYVDVKLPVKYNTTSSSGKEILFGKLSRSESVELYKSMPEGFKIKVCGEKLVIGWSNAEGFQKALDCFENEILKDSKFTSSKRLQVPLDYESGSLTPEPEPEPEPEVVHSIAELLEAGKDFSLEAKQIGHVPPVGNCYVAQGAANDGKHVFFVLRNSADTEAVILKYTLSPFNFVGVSDIFNGGHCNDLTYNDKTKKIILAHGQTQGKILTPIDAETLNVESDINITVGSGAIAYCKSKDQYAISQGGTSLHIADGNLKALKSYTRTDKTGYTAQGMGCDDKYIYFPMSKTGVDNVLVAYDWNGKFVKTMTIPVVMESESMFTLGDNYYVCFYCGGSTKGADLWQIKPLLK